MSQRKELEITIDADGKVSVQVKCVPGQSCVSESKFLEDALGGKIDSRELTAEYYEQPATVTSSNKTSG